MPGRSLKAGGLSAFGSPMRVLLRLLGLLLLAGAFAAVIVDGTRSIAAGQIELLPLGEAVGRLSPDALTHFRQAVQGRFPALWDPTLVRVLQLPIWAVLGALGLLLLIAGRPRRPVIGHSRR